MNLYHKKELFEIINKVHPISIEELKPIFDYMLLIQVKKGTVIKNTAELECKSRLIIKGYLGLFEKSQNKDICRQIFIKGTIGWDFISYSNNQETRFNLIALTDCVFSEIDKKDEPEILKNLPHLAYLAVKFNQISNSYYNIWTHFLSLPLENRLGSFYSKFPELMYFINDKCVWQLLGLSKRTFYRSKKQLKEKIYRTNSDENSI